MAPVAEQTSTTDPDHFRASCHPIPQEDLRSLMVSARAKIRRKRSECYKPAVATDRGLKAVVVPFVPLVVYACLLSHIRQTIVDVDVDVAIRVPVTREVRAARQKGDESTVAANGRLPTHL